MFEKIKGHMKLRKLISELDMILNTENSIQEDKVDLFRIINELGATKDPHACKSLVKVLYKYPIELDGEDDPGLWAIKALEEIADEQAINPLTEILIKSGYSARGRAAEEALVKIGKPVVEKLLNTPYFSIRIIDVLGSLGDERAIERLITRLRSRTRDRDPLSEYDFACVMALSKIGMPAVLTLIDLYLDISLRKFPDKNSVERTNEMMTHIGESAAKALLVRLKECTGSSLGTNERRRAIKEALIHIGATAVNPINTILQNKKAFDNLSKMNAENALREIADAAKPKQIKPPFTIEGNVWYVYEFHDRRGNFRNTIEVLNVIEGVPDNEKVTKALLQKAGFKYHDTVYYGSQSRDDSPRKSIEISKVAPEKIKYMLDDKLEFKLYDTDAHIKDLLKSHSAIVINWKELLKRADLASPEEK